MTEINDVIFTSDTLGSMNVWDLKSGTTLMTYKSNAINLRCMAVLNNDYVLAVEKGALILAWPINSQEKVQHIRMTCPGNITCIATSPDGLYIAVSIKNELRIWQFSTGKLLSFVTGHYQHISVIRWTHDGSDVITGGNDGLVCVWKLTHLISKNDMYEGISSESTSESQTAPRYTFSDHSMDINDVYVGSGGHRARLYTVSQDKTCKIYDLATGTLLLSIVFDTVPCTVVVDAAENFVFVGTRDGTIKTFSLLDPPRSRDYHLTDTSNDTTFIGHTKPVKFLATSMDGTSLISGSADETVKVWHIQSKQCLRTIRLRGEITNLIVRILPKELQEHDFKPTTILRNFLKGDADVKSDDGPIMEILTPVDFFADDSSSTSSDSDHSDTEILALRDKIEKLEKINRELYNFAVKKVIESNEPKISKTAPSKKKKPTVPVIEKTIPKGNKKRSKKKKAK